VNSGVFEEGGHLGLEKHIYEGCQRRAAAKNKQTPKGEKDKHYGIKVIFFSLLEKSK
jgi:hypothetical protein